jgi:hypothetical protein
MKTICLTVLFVFFGFYGIAQDFENSSDSSNTNPKTTSHVNAQKPKKKKGFNPDNLMFGGGLGLGISNAGGQISIAPLVGYRFHKHFQAALRASYWYTWTKFRDPIGSYHKVSDNIYTASVLGRVILIKGIYLHIEPEYMNRGSFNSNVWQSNGGNSYSLPETKRVDVFNFYIGPGFYQGFSGNRGMFVQLLWNLNQTSDSFYSNPYLQVGFAF